MLTMGEAIQACQFSLILLKIHVWSILDEGVDESRWAPRSSKPVAGRVAGRGGFDPHPFPLINNFENHMRIIGNPFGLFPI